MNEAPVRRRTIHLRVDDESGIALIIALMAMSLMLALGLALTLTTITEAQVAAYHQRGVEAQYAAQAIMERALAELRTAPDWTPFLTGTTRLSFAAGSPPGGDLVPQIDAGASHAIPPTWRLIAFGPLGNLLPGEIDSPLYVMAWVGSDRLEGVMHVFAEAIGPEGARRTLAVTMSRRLADDTVATSGGRLVSWRQDE